ncbi:MAG: hypothetical protein ABIK38_02470 [candidate division WOR-3 bacterium]
MVVIVRSRADLTALEPDGCRIRIEVLRISMVMVVPMIFCGYLSGIVDTQRL